MAKKAAKPKKSTKKTVAKKSSSKKVSRPKKAVSKGKRTPSAAFMKALTPSAALAEIVGKSPLPRTEVVKKLWAYIKKNKLQDAKNKRNINPDEKLSAVFGTKKPVNMFQMTKLVSKHLK